MHKRIQILLLTLALCVLMVGFATAQDDAPAEGDIELDETFVSEDGSTTFDYPSGWLVQEQGGLIGLISDRVILENQAVVSGTTGAQIYPPPVIFSLVPDPNQRPADALAAIMEAFLENDSITPLDDPETLNINLGMALLQRFEADTDESTVIAFQLPENNYAAMAVSTALGERDDFLPIFLAIAETFQYQVVAAPQVTAEPPPENGEALTLGVRHVSPNFNISFEYPETWLLQETDEVIVVNNQTGAVNQDGTYTPNTVQVVVFPLVTPNQYQNIFGVDTTAASTELLAAYIDTYIPSDPDETTFSEMETLVIDGKPTASQIVRGPQGDVVYYLIKDADGSFMLMAVGAPSGELEPYLATAAAMAESLRRLN